MLSGIGLATPAFARADLRGFTWNHGTIEGGPRFASDDLDFGVGIDGGYTLGQGIYLGGLFDFYFAGDDSARFGGLGASADWNAWFLMGEGGFDFGVADNLVLRPTAAIGIVTVDVEACSNVPGFADQCIDDSDSDMQGGLGGYILYNLSGLTLGGELRLMFGEFDGGWFGFNIGGVL